MPYLEWDPAFDTGIAGIDYEHRRLVGYLNDIHEAIAKGADPHGIAATLGDFHALASAHFALEEKIMRDRVCEIMDTYETESYRLGESLPATLKNWLTEAMDIDARMFAEIPAARLRAWGLSRG